jgi:hypothetical protein
VRTIGFRFLCAAAALAVLYSGVAAAASVAITSPDSGEVRHDNTGTLPVRITVDAPWSAIRVLLDAQPLPRLERSTSFTLEGIDRGEHRLEVQLLDHEDDVIATSEPVMFYMWQASRLFPNRGP